tara:strand:+ start:28 stop:963 length:936 start_codon:yes stop_codon:yes gene_type:complete
MGKNYFLFSAVLVFSTGIGLILSKHIIQLKNDQIWIIIAIVFSITMCVTICFPLLKNIFSKDDSIISNKEQELFGLKKAEKYRREFLGNVSHELKTPIFNIQGYIETLIDGALYDKTVNKKYLKRTSKSVDRLIYIIRDLESIGQLDSDQINLEITNWKLSELINEIIDQFEIKSAKKKIKLFNKKSTTNIIVSADKDKIAQVLSNLISNSIKYGKRGGRTTISSFYDKGKCIVSIKDNGIGIADKNIKRLFERFYRVDKSRSREQGGTGLGLAIVKHIIEAHDQKIQVKSKIGKGTEFLFSMNLHKSSKD